MKEPTVQSVRHPTARLQKSAGIRADEEARRIPWQRLHEARNHYVDWQEFCFWARSILETENGIPDWVDSILQTCCPGFLEKTEHSRRKPLGSGPWLLAWKIGLKTTSLASRNERVGSSRLLITPCGIHVISERKSAGRNALRSGRKPSLSGIRRSKNGKPWRRSVTKLPI